MWNCFDHCLKSVNIFHKGVKKANRGKSNNVDTKKTAVTNVLREYKKETEKIWQQNELMTLLANNMSFAGYDRMRKMLELTNDDDSAVTTRTYNWRIKSFDQKKLIDTVRNMKPGTKVMIIRLSHTKLNT